MKIINKILIALLIFIAILLIHKISFCSQTLINNGDVTINVTDENIYEYNVNLEIESSINEFSYYISKDIDFLNETDKLLKQDYAITDIECNLNYTIDEKSENVLYIQLPQNKNDDKYKINVKYKLHPNKYTFLNNKLMCIPINHFKHDYNCQNLSYKIIMPQKAEFKVSKDNFSNPNNINDTIIKGNINNTIKDDKINTILIKVPKNYFKKINNTKEIILGLLSIVLIAIPTVILYIFREKLNNKMTLILSTLVIALFYLLEFYTCFNIVLNQNPIPLLIIVLIMAILNFLTLFFMTKRSSSAIVFYVVLLIILISSQALFRELLKYNKLFSISAILSFIHLVIIANTIKHKKSMDNYGG